MANQHPKWNGNFSHGYDIAILQLPRKVSFATPAIADHSTKIYPNTRVYILKFGAVLEVAQFEVVANEFCPIMMDLGDSHFCVFSRESSVQSGMWGSNLVYLIQCRSEYYVLFKFLSVVPWNFQH